MCFGHETRKGITHERGGRTLGFEEERVMGQVSHGRGTGGYMVGERENQPRGRPRAQQASREENVLKGSVLTHVSVRCCNEANYTKGFTLPGYSHLFPGPKPIAHLAFIIDAVCGQSHTALHSAPSVPGQLQVSGAFSSARLDGTMLAHRIGQDMVLLLL